jgi:hypothetical protein
MFPSNPDAQALALAAEQIRLQKVLNPKTLNQSIDFQ